MASLSENEYDAIIIGAGISGLVCGCYLARAGMKVLICEQHFKPGGYCTSFTRKGFTFDAAAHSFGSYRVGGNMNRVLNELDIVSKIKIDRYDPSDVVITPDFRVSFGTDVRKTIHELQSFFPAERDNIYTFINFMAQPTPLEMAAMRKKTFKSLLDNYFSDERLKAILSITLLGNGGLPPSLMSAFTGSKIFTEFLIDGGYYPHGGMQELPNALSERFQELGGKLLLSAKATKISLKSGRVCGVVLDKYGMLSANKVISNCDARQTFLELLDMEPLRNGFINKINRMIPSLSMFIVYVGIDKQFKELPKAGSTLWFLPHYSLDKMYEAARNRNIHNLGEYLLRLSPDNKTILAMTNTAFKSNKYWTENKSSFLSAFLDLIEGTLLPGLSRHITCKYAATPNTLYRYTLNYHGASYGWASTPSQFADSDFRKPSFIKGLYLTGHWTTYAQGIAGVAYLGYDTARTILKNHKNSYY